MKSSIRFASGIMTLLIAVGTLSSCGTRTQTVRTAEPVAVDHVWHGDYITLPEDIEIYDGTIRFDGTVYTARGMHILSEETWETESVQVTVDPETKDVTYSVIPMAEGMGWINSYVASPDGNLVLYSGYDEAREEQFFRLYGYDKTGAERFCLDPKDLFRSLLDEEKQWFYVDDVICSGNGTCYLMTDSAVAAITGDGEYLYDFSTSGYIENHGMTADGQVYISYYDFSAASPEAGIVNKIIDDKTKGPGADLILPEKLKLSYNDHLQLAPGHDVYYTNDNGLYAMDLEDEAPVMLCSWLNSDLSSDEVRYSISVLDAEHALYTTYDPVSYAQMLCILSPVAPEDVVPKYLIHVACADRIQPIQRFAIAFNRESDKYRVVIDNYNTYEDGTDSFALLKNDITVGNIPDVIVCGYDFDFDVLDRQGLFRDFYSYMDEDGETLNRDVFLPCALRPFENQRGELHGLIAGFNLVSAAADKAVLGGKTSVTAADLLSIAEGLKDGQYLYALRMYEDEKPAEMLLEKLLTLQFDSYIDYKNAACHFDDGDFADLLRLCKTAPVLNLAAMDMEDISVSTLLKNGDLVFLDLPWFESPSSYLQAKYYDFAGSEMVLTGYPTVSGNTCGTVIEPAYRYTITKTSPVAEGAWQFIKRTFGTFEGDRFNGYSGESFSPCRPVLDSVFEKESRRFYSFSEWGWGCSEGSPEDDLDKLWQEILEQCAMSGELPGHMTAEDEAFLRELLDSVTSAAHNDTEISAIIKEEASAYFAGAKSVEEVVKLIQSRVSLYVSEVYG